MEPLNSTKQCPNCNHWFTQQKSFRHLIRHCKRNIAAERENPANQLLLLGSSKSVFEGGTLNIFQRGGDKGSTKVGERGFSSLIDFDFNGGHNDDLYFESSNNDSDINRDVNTEGQIDESSFHPSLQWRTMAMTKFQLMLNDLLLKHNASLLLFDEICELFNGYLSSPHFDRFAKFKSRKSLLRSTEKSYDSASLKPIMVLFGYMTSPL
jgi:hypothetical protein